MKDYSYPYQKQPLYRMMIWNMKENLAKQKSPGLDRDDFNVFELTASIAFVLNMSKESVMNDYLLFSKEPIKN